MRKLIVLSLLLGLSSLNGYAKPTRHRQVQNTLLPPSRQSLLLQNQIINQMGLERIGDEKELKRLVNDGTLVALPNDVTVRITSSLPSNRRYVLPMAHDFIVKLASEYYAEFGLPLQINSAVRPASVQQRLRRYNPSAAPAHGEAASSHETGATVDFERTRLTPQQRFWLEIRLAQLEAVGIILVEEEQHCFHTMVVTKEIV